MGIFGDSPQAQVDLDHLTDRVTRLEAALSSLQAEVAELTRRGLLAGSASADGGTTGAVTPADSEWLGEVRRLKQGGNVIGAIKLDRENTGLGLREAKDAVGSMS